MEPKAGWWGFAALFDFEDGELDGDAVFDDAISDDDATTFTVQAAVEF